MPSLSEALSGVVAQNLTSALEEALKSKLENASVSSLSGELSSEAGWINSTIRFEVTGVSSRKGDLLTIYCSWISFSIPQDLKIGNLSYNRIGAAYIRQTFERYVNFTSPPLNETVSGVTYLSRGNELPPRVATDRAGNVTLLDFSNLTLEFERWKRTFNVSEGSTVWIYDPGPAIDLEMKVVPRATAAFSHRALYSYNGSISVDANAKAEGNRIIMDVGGGFEPLLMLVIILSIFALAVVASWSYRSRRRQIPRRRR